MTLAVMEAFGVTVNNRKFRRFDVRPARYKGREYAVEPDASAASYFFALAALTGGTVTVEGLGTSSIQGDMAFVDVLEHMGCAVEREPMRTTVTGGPLHAVDVDMNAFSDTVMTQAVVALFAGGVSRIRNVAHIRHKETDRIHCARDRAPPARRAGRRAARRPGDRPPCSRSASWSTHRHLQRPPHGHVVRAGRLAHSRSDDPRPGLCRQDLSWILD